MKGCWCGQKKPKSNEVCVPTLRCENVCGLVRTATSEAYVSGLTGSESIRASQILVQK
jgi:hypothetical protein